MSKGLLIPRHEGWNSTGTWTKRHESGLFSMKIAVHQEKTEEERSRDYHSAPKCWNTYLLGGDTCRYYPERRIERCPITDQVFAEGRNFFERLEWNGGVTFFQRKVATDEAFDGYRTWEVGDDFVHLWDSEGSRWDYYDFNYMKRCVEFIGNQFAEMLVRRRIVPAQEKGGRDET